MDEGPAHRLLVLRETLAEVFGNRVVALQNEVDSPIQSPDLTPCNLFLGLHEISSINTSPLSIIDLHQRKNLAKKSWQKSWLENFLLGMLLGQWKFFLAFVLEKVEKVL